MRYILILLIMICCMATSAMAQVSFSFGLPGLSIGISQPFFPDFAQIPGYPVYYAPRLNSNYFFYDGLYWVYVDDNWYASDWYNGPWGLVQPELVPLFVLRIPVHYYRNPPPYFRGWRSDEPPRWGERWGNAWEQRHSGWDNWDHRAAVTRAPLPVYQRQYSGQRYPDAPQQQALRNQNYPYQPSEAIVRQHYQEQSGQRAPSPAQREQPIPGERQDQVAPVQREPQATPPGRVQPAAPSAGHPQRQDMQQSRLPPPVQAPPQQRSPAGQEQRPQAQPPRATAPREQPTARPVRENTPQSRGGTPEPRAEQARPNDGGKGDDRGQERDKQR